MSTPRDAIEHHANQLAFDTALLVNKAHAAALVAIHMPGGCDEELFIEVCRAAWQSTSKTVAKSRADYLAKMLPPEPSVPPQEEPKP